VRPSGVQPTASEKNNYNREGAAHIRLLPSKTPSARHTLRTYADFDRPGSNWSDRQPTLPDFFLPEVFSSLTASFEWRALCECTRVCLQASYHAMRAHLKAQTAEAGARQEEPAEKEPLEGVTGTWLPLMPLAIELVAIGHRSLERPLRCAVLDTLDPLLDWLEAGMPNENFDLSEDAIWFEAPDGSEQTLSARELLEAKKVPDGRFELADGRAFYFLEIGDRR